MFYHFGARYIFVAALLLPVCLQAATINCKVVGVHDGDTLTCLTAQHEQIKVRLAEIDTPEVAQPYGSKAKEVLSGLVFGKQVNLDKQATDRYGRTVALVSTESQAVNREMVHLGAAWVYRQYNNDQSLLSLEADAKAARRGLWSMPEADIVPPWEWRKAGKNLGKQVAGNKAAAASSSAYDCGSKRYCKQMTSCDEARYYLIQCGMSGLDRDGDEKPCENVCR